MQSTVDRSNIGKAKVGPSVQVVNLNAPGNKRVVEPVIYDSGWAGSSESGVTQLRKDAFGDGKDSLRMAETYPPGPSDVKVWRRFVYGLNYIDELVAQITPSDVENPGSVRYVIQDANHNVVGIVRACDGEIIRQYRYTPYGELTAIEGEGGTVRRAAFTRRNSFSVIPLALRGGRRGTRRANSDRASRVERVDESSTMASLRAPRRNRA